MKVNLKGLFANVLSEIPSRRREYHQFCLDEVLEHIQGVVDGKYTVDEFAEHYCIDRSRSESNKVKPVEHGSEAGRDGRCE